MEIASGAASIIPGIGTAVGAVTGGIMGALTGASVGSIAGNKVGELFDESRSLFKCNKCEKEFNG